MPPPHSLLSALVLCSEINPLIFFCVSPFLFQGSVQIPPPPKFFPVGMSSSFHPFQCTSFHFLGIDFKAREQGPPGSGLIHRCILRQNIRLVHAPSFSLSSPANFFSLLFFLKVTKQNKTKSKIPRPHSRRFYFVNLEQKSGIWFFSPLNFPGQLDVPPVLEPLPQSNAWNRNHSYPKAVYIRVLYSASACSAVIYIYI